MLTFQDIGGNNRFCYFCIKIYREKHFARKKLRREGTDKSLRNLNAMAYENCAWSPNQPHDGWWVSTKGSAWDLILWVWDLDVRNCLIILF